VCARLNYLSQDRPDIKFAVKEASRHMASPKEGDFLLLKRIGRYLQGQPRLLQKFTWQKEPRVAQTHVDSDWAGCKRTCRSTSGGTISFGNHTLTAWSTTQAVVAMSSGEAELFALTKGAAHTLGAISLASDFGARFDGRVCCDSAAAIGIVNRAGAGKLRHVKVQYLWMQQKVREGDLQVEKVPGAENPADLLTKHLDEATMMKHLTKLSFELKQDRAATAPTLHMVREGAGGASEEGEPHEDKWLVDGETATKHHAKMRRTLFLP